MRFAFLTTEYVKSQPTAGGLGTYVNRMAGLLKKHGHEVEIFTIGNSNSVSEHNGLRVHECTGARSGLSTRLIRRFVQNPLDPSMADDAKKIARVFEDRHKVEPFHVVQSSDFRAIGSAIKKRGDRRHLIRCSSAIDLYMCADGLSGPRIEARVNHELENLRNADIVYAPSRFTAEHYRAQFNIDVHVVRPPAYLEQIPLESKPKGAPKKYMLHFGSLMKRKGTFDLLEAFELAYRDNPEIVLVIIGRTWGDELVRSTLGNDSRGNCLILREMDKQLLYAWIKHASFTVLPSEVDNLPNTVIESLLLGVPCVGTRPSSIEELITDNAKGLLVPVNDVKSLASAILQMWQNDDRDQQMTTFESEILEAMKPENAYGSFMGLLGC